ncbi:MAG: fatty acid desaturase [Burkholderiaceae bacterium]
MIDSILSFLDTGLLNFSWWQIVIYTLVVTHITIAGVTIYLHRCQAHRALDLHPVVSHFFRFWLWLTTGMVTKEWAAVHRKHHAKCETVDDPHSPQIFGIKKVLLEGAELYRVSAADKPEIDRYGHGTPDDWIERNLYSKHSVWGVYLTLVINVLLFGAIGLTVFAIQMLWIPFWAAGVINGVGHYVGYRNFDVADTSTNLVPWGFLIGGEELHNNHHAFGSSAKFSNKWYEIDVGWGYIKMMSWLGLAKVRKVAPKPKLVAARSKIDLEALQAVIHHRYDVMATYAAKLRRACNEEARRLRSIKAPESQLIASARSWLARDDSKWSQQHRAKLPEVMAASDRLRTLVEMRSELSQLWERSHQSGEQLVHQLQQWCARAEASGVRALQEMALRLRSYAAV